MPPSHGLLYGTLIFIAAGTEQDVRVGNVSVLGGRVADLQWMGENKTVVLLQSHHGFLLRSADGGETWASIRDKMNRSALIHGVSPNAQIRRLVRSPADTNTIFAQGAGDDSFVSTDAGLTWTRLQLTARVQGFAFHAKKAKWALLSYWTAACSNATLKDKCSHNLYITKNLGKTFSLVCSHVVQFNWGKVSFSQQDRVYLTHFRDKSTNQQRLTRWLQGLDFAFTDNLGKEVTKLVAEGNKFQMSYEYILVVKVTNAGQQTVKLMISSDGGAHFAPARLPESVRQHSFVLLDASEGALVLHVHQGVDVGDVYISDSSGINFTLSLRRNVRHSGLCAFEKVMNLNGIYIANRHETYDGGVPAHDEEVKEPVEGSSTDTQTDAVRSFRSRRLGSSSALSPWEDEEEAEGLPAMTQAEVLRASRTRRGRRLAASSPSQNHVTTVISFDGGGEWLHLRAPKIDSLGKNISCGTAHCWLHLHDFTEVSTFSPVYSYLNAVGIIMGSGNVGPYLSTRREDTNTYMSRDGGTNWWEVHKGTWIYEFGNHGGLLVMADMVNETRDGLFSWNEGHSWHSFKLSETPMKVDNVIIEPEATSTKFLLYGERNGVGVARLLDFGKVHERTCHGIAHPGGADSDYEQWVVPCILGQQGVYTRRKRNAQCFNNETTDRYRSRRSCMCRESSYECNVGFRRHVGNIQCALESTEMFEAEMKIACASAKNFSVMPYRKVPGDVCEGGWKPKPMEIPCPPVRSAVHPAQHHKLEATQVQPTQSGLLPLKLILIVTAVVGGMCFARSTTFQGWFHRKDLPYRAPQGPGGARECTGQTIGHSASEMAGLGGYRPPTF